MDAWVVNSSFFNINGVTPPTQCAPLNTAADCVHAALQANAIVWDITHPGSVDLSAPSLAWNQGRMTLQDWFANAVSGSHNTFDWSNTMRIVSVPGGDTFVYITGGAPLSSVPLPPAAWLFGSGFLGLASIARRKSS